MKRILSILNLLLLTFVLSAQGVRYTTANLNLRLKPTTSAQIITVMPKGTPVTLDDDCDCKWIPVSYNGLVGYVSSNYLSKVKPTYSTSSNSTVEYSQASSNYIYLQKNVNHPIGRVRYYTNSSGEGVQSPTYYNRVPNGATALCRDGTYSFSRSRRGTCSGHGGVARWL